MTLATREPAQITEEIVLSTLKLKPNDANTITALALCQRYDLDPVLKHILIVSGNVYVTRDGLLYTAHKSGKLDGMEVLEMGETATHYTARVAVYRKDMSRPFVYPGRYPKAGSNKAFGPEMAVKVSEVMGLRRAFSIAASVLEERWDDDAARETLANLHEPVREVQVLPPARDNPDRQNRVSSDGPISTEEAAQASLENIPGLTKGAAETNKVNPAQVKDLGIIGTELGFGKDDRDRCRSFFAYVLSVQTGEVVTLGSVKDLERAQAKEIINALSAWDENENKLVLSAQADEFMTEWSASQVAA